MPDPSTLASCLAVPLCHWYHLVVAEAEDVESVWLEEYHAQGVGVYAAHCSRRAGHHEPPSMELLFKCLPDYHAVANKLCSEGKTCSFNMYAGMLLNHSSILDLPYVDMVFTCKHVDIPALIDVMPLKANKTNHLHSFLQYEKYPPLVPVTA